MTRGRRGPNRRMEEDTRCDVEIPRGLFGRLRAPQERFRNGAERGVEEAQPQAHQRRFASIASQIFAVALTPLKRSSS